MKKAVAGILLLVGLALAAVLANQAVQRDLDYRRFIDQGDEALSRGDTFLAIDAFSGAIALNPDSMLAYLKRGEAYQRRGDTPETLTAALRDLRTATELDPGATRALEELGDVNFKMRRYANAVEAYESYLQLDDQVAVVFYKVALASRAAGRLPRAVEALQKAVKLNASFPEAHYLLGLCLKERDQLKEARAAFEQAVRVSPAMIPAREELADLDRIQGQRRDEIEQLEALAALDARKAERLIAVGLAHLKRGNRDLAVNTLGLAAERFHEHPGVYTALGQVWLQTAEDRGDPTDVRKALEALEPIASQPDASSEVLGLYGRALTLAGQPDRAEEAFREAAQRFPIDPSVLPPYASLAQRLGHLEDARQALVRYSVLADDDLNKAAHAARIADLSLQLNDAATAMQWYEKPETLSAADATQLTRLAEVQLKMGRAQDAPATVIRALAKDPASVPALALARQIGAKRPATQAR